MKLTNYLRNVFVSAVMQDVPVQDFDDGRSIKSGRGGSEGAAGTLRAAWLDPCCGVIFDTRPSPAW